MANTALPYQTSEEEFAWRVEGCAFHEAAHAVGFAACEVEMSEARIIHKGHNPKTIEGYVRVNPRQMDEADPDGVVVAILAGLTAHARWFHHIGGLDRTEALQHAEDIAADGDLLMVRRYLQKGTRTSAHARAAARHMVIDRWATITRIANRLKASKELAGSEIYRLI